MTGFFTVRILITSGPTRQYLDPVRFLSNASSGRMGSALAQSALDRGHEVVIVSGPVVVTYPPQATVIPVVTTEEMCVAAQTEFAQCDGVIGAAAPCDFRCKEVATNKMKKNGQPIMMEMIETVDIMQCLGLEKTPTQWSVGFALETDNTETAVDHAVAKLKHKFCDLIVLNGAAAMESTTNAIRIIDAGGKQRSQFAGTKLEVADVIINAIESL